MNASMNQMLFIVLSCLLTRFSPQLSSFQNLIALLPSQQRRESEMFTLARKSQAFGSPTMQNRQSFIDPRRRSTAIGTIVRAISSSESNEAHSEMEDAIAAAKMLKSQPVRLQNRLGSVRYISNSLTRRWPLPLLSVAAVRIFLRVCCYAWDMHSIL